MVEVFRKRSFGISGLISVLLLTLIIGLLAFKTRHDQWNTWKLNKNITFYENSPLLSTADGPYFIGLAKKISEGSLIGWFQDSMEFSHRALGNRSILADPRNKNIKGSENADIIKNELAWRTSPGSCPSIGNNQIPDITGMASSKPRIIAIIKPCLNTRLIAVIFFAPRACEVSDETTISIPRAKK